MYRNSGACAVMSTPSKNICPLRGLRNPVMVSTKIVFPLPDGPNTAWIELLFIDKEMSLTLKSSAWTERFFSSSMGDPFLTGQSFIDMQYTETNYDGNKDHDNGALNVGGG